MAGDACSDDIERRLERIERELGIDPEVAIFEEVVREFVRHTPRYEMVEIADSGQHAVLRSDTALTDNSYRDLLDRFEEACVESDGDDLLVKVYGCNVHPDADRREVDGC